MLTNHVIHRIANLVTVLVNRALESEEAVLSACSGTAESLEGVGRVDLEDGDVGFGAVVLDGGVDEGGFVGGVGGALDLGCVRF